MKYFFWIFIILFSQNICFAKHLNPEKYYQQKWCEACNGILEYRLTDGARVDCLTKNYAIEFDFANKWAESIGQSLYYALKTGRKPGIVLIISNEKDCEKYLKRLYTVANLHGIRVWTMNE